MQKLIGVTWPLVAAILLAGSAIAQPISDFALSAAYCFGYEQQAWQLLKGDEQPPLMDCSVGAFPGDTVKCRKYNSDSMQLWNESRQHHLQDIGRLRLYLLSKGFGDPSQNAYGFVAALNRGKSDAITYFKQSEANLNDLNSPYQQCFHGCLSKPNSDSCVDQCNRAADRTGIYDRAGRCEQIKAALPF